ncbi:MAG: molecular chaperone DnaK (HSP70), partial [Myxococcota bacterium]
MLLGIDFGTTRTVVAHSDRGNFPLIAFETPDGDLLDHFPTLVAARDGELRYGPEAGAVLGVPGWTGLRSFKRLLANADANVSTPVALGDTVVPLGTLLTGFLTALHAAIRGATDAPEATLRAMVATPAGAHSTWRFATLEAFNVAGFEVVGVLDEPSAGAVEYAHRYAGQVTTARQRVLIYDLGGGTFDASLVDLHAGGHTVVSTRGLPTLGGDDLDAAILALALSQAGLAVSALGAATHTALLEHVRGLKEAINPNTRRVHVEVGAHLSSDEREALGVHVDTLLTLPIADVYAACAPLVEHTLATVAGVVPRSNGVFDDDGLSGVYVVGGASSLPVVARMLRTAFGRRVRRAGSPSGSTAIGLAIAAGSDLQL